MEKIDFDKVYDDLEKIKNKIVKEYIEIYNSRSNDEKIGVYNSTIFGNRIGNAIDYLNDVCGGACIHFRDRRSSFFNQYKEYLRNLPGNKGSRWLDVHIFSYPHSGRQELEVNEAVANACCKYINENCGASCYVRTYID